MSRQIEEFQRMKKKNTPAATGLLEQTANCFFFFWLNLFPNSPSLSTPPTLPKKKKKKKKEPLEATIWAHDRASGGLVLASAGSTPLVHNVRITSASAVSKIVSAEAPEAATTTAAAAAKKEPSSEGGGGGGGADAPATPSSSGASAAFDPLAKLPALDEAKCRERLDRAVHAAATRAAKIGVGVSRRAQAAFDALDKTLPCAWGGGGGDGASSGKKNSSASAIVVLGEVVVEGPEYSSESASAVEGAAAKASSRTLERVRMVLDAARDELPPP